MYGDEAESKPTSGLRMTCNVLSKKLDYKMGILSILTTSCPKTMVQKDAGVQEALIM